MATLNDAFKTEVERIESIQPIETTNKDQLLIAMCSLLIQLLQQLKDENGEAIVKKSNGLIPSPS